MRIHMQYPQTLTNLAIIIQYNVMFGHRSDQILKRTNRIWMAVYAVFGARNAYIYTYTLYVYIYIYIRETFFILLCGGLSQLT